jgi:ectoine hydroxylase-related dioxygenase (phytanoyl-CoA dioxygenase family)
MNRLRLGGVIVGRMKHDYEDIREYLGRDLAKKYRESGDGALDAAARASLEPDLKSIAERGFVIYESLITKDEVAAINQALEPHFGAAGRTGIEGFTTRRIYSVLKKTRACDVLVDHPKILALLELTMEPHYLLSQLQAISIDPGEKAQPIHTDDIIYPGQRPRAALSTATVWALDDFTADNGATVVIPGSHVWGDEDPSPEHERIPVIMPAGSVVFFLGNLWHGGGANRSNHSRRAVSAQYCQPWLRGQENLFLGTPREVARVVSPAIKSMLGYSLHPPFMGMVDGMHPSRLLE